MFRRLFGKSKKKRLSPSARTPEGLLQSHPMYQYALTEYAQTVAPMTSNDDGRIRSYPMPIDEEESINFGSDSASMAAGTETGSGGDLRTTDSTNLRSRSPSASISQTGTGSNVDGNYLPPPVSQQSSVAYSHPHMAMSQSSIEVTASQQPLSPKTDYIFSTVSSTVDEPTTTTQKEPMQNHYHYPRRPTPEFAVPEAAYEEYYGDAYVGGPLKYIYPSGYQSMRPRGGPWKLSIVVCLLFTWLSVFIIGHCSDRVDQSLYDNSEIDDDTLVIETRWCGSRLLYMMWVMCMLTTGLASAYCSVIGYIKVRDFAVANSRSQPPGMIGKSDYYVEIKDSGPPGQSPKSIYQSDGTPQFWGSHIYKPTQAAVAITSR